MVRISKYLEMYCSLDLELGNRSYFCNNYDTMYPPRGGYQAAVVDLNFKPWIADRNCLCSLCNLRENQAVFPFVTVCPILVHVGVKFFYIAFLTKTEFEDYLNGKDWRMSRQIYTGSLDL